MRARTRSINRVIRVSAEPPADLTIGAALDPEQSLSSGTTTATVEWPDATGGTAPYTYAISVKDEAGSAVTPNSGSGKGPYVLPVADGKSYQATIGVTDADGQVARRAALVHVAAAPGTVGWELVFDGDFASVTPATKTGSGSEAIVGGDFDGLTWAWTNNSANGGTAYLTTDGIKAVGGSGAGSYEAGINISSLMTANDEDDFVIALYLRDIAGVTGATRGLRAGISAAGTLSSGTNDGMKAQYQSSGIWTPNIMRNDTTTTSYAGAVSIATSGRLLVRCFAGRIAFSNWAQGETALPDAAAIDALFLHQASFSAKAAQVYTSALHVGINAIFIAEVELYRVAIYKKGVV